MKKQENQLQKALTVVCDTLDDKITVARATLARLERLKADLRMELPDTSSLFPETDFLEELMKMK